MNSKTETPKAFDCVDFKRQSQQRLNFDSYLHFLRAKVHEDAWARSIWERIGARKAP